MFLGIVWPSPSMHYYCVCPLTKISSVSSRLVNKFQLPGSRFQDGSVSYRHARHNGTTSAPRVPVALFYAALPSTNMVPPGTFAFGTPRKPVFLSTFYLQIADSGRAMTVIVLTRYEI